MLPLKRRLHPFLRPLKHTRYPWGSNPERHGMTIAAGFLCRDGIVLCADTEQQTWTMKIHAPKIGYFECPGGRVSYAYAGNSAFALTSIQKCQRVLESTIPEDTFTELEKCLDRQYRKLVLSNPAYQNDQSLAYSFLIGFWSPTQPPKLYATHETAIRQVDGNYECVGVGDSLAHYLIRLRPSFNVMMPEREVISLAGYALAAVKGYVPGCGGASQFLAIRNDGTCEFIDPGRIRKIENYSQGYDVFARRLLFTITDSGVSDEEFQAQLATFSNRMIEMRVNYQASTIQEQLDPESTTPDPQPPQPSPESPGESDES